jgi:CHAD domain-containing protein
MTLLEKRSERLRAGLSSTLARLADDISAKKIHRLRTTIRRIETLITFAEPEMGKKQEKAMEQLALLRKRGGRVRDLDVQLGLLGAIGNTSASGDRRLLADALKRKRDKQLERLSAVVAEAKEQKFRVLFDAIAAQAAGAPQMLDESGEPFERAKRAITELADEYASQAKPKPGALHEIRIRLKKIRYLAELGEESPEQKQFLVAIKSVQDALGAWHDWEGLAKAAGKEFDSRVNCPLLVEVRALFAAKRSAAVAAVSELLSTWQSLPPRKQVASLQPFRTMAQRA